ncbi:MAG: hypothetical protein L0323_09535 [Planctomycetes bacterium]|nr:hypothetical protein [Planctomycetota bacterium]
MKRTAKGSMDEVAALLRETACPACGLEDLEFVLRCDLGFGACLWTARCTTFGMLFEMVSADEALPEEFSGPRESGACPGCGGTAFEPRIVCRLATRQCVYLLECVNCRPTFR